MVRHMEITDVNVFRVDGERLKGYATVIFDNVFIVRDLKIIDGNNGLFVAMPNKRTKNGTYRDIAHPLNKEMRDNLEKRIIQKYNNSSAGT
ncbi:MAG: septation regulator SpoVG [bacterium]